MGRSTGAGRWELHTGWTVALTAADPTAPPEVAGLAVPATVPGCVHQDLLATGHLADPDVGTAEDDQHWVGRSTWTYATTVSWEGTDHDRVDLVCDGLDTIAEVRLNGRAVGTTRNMHRRHRFPVTDLLRVGANELTVRFAPVYEYTDALRRQVGELPAPYPTPYMYVRKNAGNFGWDWGPSLVTAGIWRPIALEAWSTARLAGVRPLTSVDRSTGRLDLHVEVEHAATQRLPLTVRAAVGGVEAEVPVAEPGAGDATHLAIDVPDVGRWWPVGMGEQHRYDLTVDLLDEGGEVLDRAERRVGFRTVAVEEVPDDVGTRWALVVNGHRVPVRGFNWIPDDPLVATVDPDRYARRIHQAVDADANLLRVWGGGIYETAAFYDRCDELGLLVWQDFLFSCAAYPELPEVWAEVEAEARQAITDRSHHPSLVLWNGNNECVWGWHDWGWQEVLAGRPWGAGYYVELLPRLVTELDPSRPYLPGSPWGGGLERPPNDHRVGVSHVWDVWNDVDYVHYRDHEPAFVAEMGWCGPPAWATLRRAVPEGELTLANPVVRHHLRAADGVTKLDRGMAAHFPEVDAADDWHFLAQVTQARAMTVGVDHLRGVERCAGVVVWQLNDCWPVISWAAIDGDERRKPVWYALRAAFAPRRATVQPDTGTGLALVAVNDTLASWATSVRVARVDVDGTVLAQTAVDVEVVAAGVTRAPLPADVVRPGEPSRELVVVEADGRRTTWFWAEDRDLDYPAAAWDVEVAAADGGLRVAVTARSLLRDLCLFPDRLVRGGAPLPADAVVDDSLVTLLPGESHVFEVTGAGAEHADAIGSRPVLRCVNDVPELQAAPTSPPRPAD